MHQEFSTDKTTIMLSSENCASWPLRGRLLLKFSGLEFEEVMISPDDPPPWDR
jgi:glutathione S-transferase